MISDMEICPKCNRHKYYFDKGIKVCKEWDSFESFRRWSIESGYSDNLTIDRIDSNGNYEPNNCRWASQIEQQNNRTSNRFIEYGGEIHTISEWARIKGIKRGTLWNRFRLGWDAEKALKP